MTLSFAMVGSGGTLGTVGTPGAVDTSVVGSSLVLDAVGTVRNEGAPVTLVLALVTFAHFTGAEGRLMTSSSPVPTVESTARDVMPRQFPPGVPLIREQSL